MIFRTLATASLATALFGPPATGQEPRLFGVNSSAGARFLVTIDKTTADLTIVGPTGIDIDGLAFAPDGTLYAADNTDPANPQLVTLDPATGAVDQVIGSFGLGSQRWVEGLAVHPVTGELFGVDTKPDNLVKIDLTTGFATIVGPFGAPTESAGLSFSKDGSVLYLIDWMDGCLYRVEPVTGSASVIGCDDVEEPLGLATDPTDGQLYSADLSSGTDMTLSLVDASTGQRTDVGIMVGGNQIEGLTFEPGNSDPFTFYCDPTDGHPSNTATIWVSGNQLSAGPIDICLSGGPPNQFANLLIGNGNQIVSQPPGAKGDLCIVGGSCLGRYSKDIGMIGPQGGFCVDIENSVSGGASYGIPTCGGNIQPGETWTFQYWHRQPMGQPSTFSQAVRVTFEQ